jgi:hypothetical protein
MIFLTAKKMHDDLELWIQIGIGDDIVDFKQHRTEYQHIVNKFKNEPKENIPDLVLNRLKVEMKKPYLLQETFWRLLKFNLKFAIYQTRKSISGSINSAIKRLQ